MRKLSDDERNFLQQFITNKGFLQRRKVAKDFIQFDRRRGKVVQTLGSLPPGDDQVKKLSQSLAAAEALAKQGQFTDAYHGLLQVKQQARAAVAAHAAEHTPESVRRDIRRLDGEVRSLVGDLEDIDEQTAALFADLQKEPKWAECKTRREATRRQGQFCAGRGADLQQRFAGVKDLQGQVIAALPAPELTKQFVEAGQRIGVLEKTGKKPLGELTAALSAVVARAKRNGKVLSEAGLEAEFRQQQEEFDRLFAEVAKLPDGGAGSKPGAQILAGLARREEERLREARKRFNEEFGADARLLANQEDRPRPVQSLPRYDAAGLFREVRAAVGSLTPAGIQDFCDEVQERMKDELEELANTPDSDLLFDLAVKGKAGFAADIAASFGRYIDPLTNKERMQSNRAGPPNPNNLPEIDDGESKTLILQIAERMAETVAGFHPNTASSATVQQTARQTNGNTVTVDVAASFTCNGETYQNPKVLAAGGLGVTTRYQNAAGEYVVLKSVLPGGDREAMEQELRVHRHVMGGAGGKGHPNVVALKGAVVGDDGGLHMALEYVDAGDVQDFSNGLHAACQNGMLSPQARDALVQRTFLQAVKGLKFAQDQNTTHHDIKPSNYLITADGTVKLADFGSGQVADNPEGNVGGVVEAHTPHFDAPEMNRPDQPVTGKADVYTLGVMLTHLTSETAAEERKPEFESHVDRRRYRNEASGMALDRLRNAMLDKDPDKRPTLGAVALGAYLQAPNSVPEGAVPVEGLLKAVAAYSKELGGAGRDLQFKIMAMKGTVLKKEREREKAQPDKVQGIDDEMRKLKRTIDERQQQLDQIHAAIRNDPTRKHVIEDLERLDREARGLAPDEDEATKLWRESTALLRQIQDLEKEKQESGMADEEAAGLDEVIAELRGRHKLVQEKLLDLTGESEEEEEEERRQWNKARARVLDELKSRGPGRDAGRREGEGEERDEDENEEEPELLRRRPGESDEDYDRRKKGKGKIGG